ncbi:hypothetical protein RhiirC2_500322 [Rhizophagus irregularis]|uniref:Uncharacterized protein n=1 Tax=Rhizophagus irregularis TaxID=588596 RepID=A0A2N1N6K8_9GLOM|nr:hypothetical protein RhiirC2_500322 [Rhizophagus irregularis]
MNRYKKNLSFLSKRRNQNTFLSINCNCSLVHIFFHKHKHTHIKTMSSLPASPASITEEISSRTMSDVVKDFNTEELIDYLERKDLKLDEDDIKILRKEKISGRSFLN